MAKTRFCLTLEKTDKAIIDDYENQFGKITYEETDKEHIKALALYMLIARIVNEPDVEGTIDTLGNYIEDNYQTLENQPLFNEIYNWIQTLAAVEDGDYR